LCTSTLGFADKLNINILERNVERLMEFCSKTSCPASTLETRVNAIVNSVMNKVNSIQYPAPSLIITQSHIEEAIFLERAKLVIKGVQTKISEYINKKSSERQDLVSRRSKEYNRYAYWNGIIKAVNEDLNKASNLKKTVTSSSSKIETKLSLFSSYRQISERLSTYEDIISLDLPYEEKTKYKQDVENPSSDFNAVLMNAKATAKGLKKNKIRR
jgi:hypothetical protein